MKEDEWVITEETVNDLQERLRIVNKVEELLSMPDAQLATVEMVAEYYEVDVEVIERVTSRHQDELYEDGVSNYSEWGIKHLFRLNGIQIPTYGILLFHRRAIYKVGMLLDEGAIAEEFRDQFLSIAFKSIN